MPVAGPGDRRGSGGPFLEVVRLHFNRVGAAGGRGCPHGSSRTDMSRDNFSRSGKLPASRVMHTFILHALDSPTGSSPVARVSSNNVPALQEQMVAPMASRYPCAGRRPGRDGESY